MKKNVPILMAILLLATTAIMAQTKWYVKAGHTTGTHTGESWANAFNTLQHALDSAQAGDVIWVAKGTYTQTAAYGLGTKDIKLYGSFAGTETSIDQRTFSGTDTTILDATGANVCVFHLQNRTNATVIDGFKITGGSANYGGGVYNSSSSPILNNLTISGNTATTHGGGMYNNNSSPVLTNVTISGNTANYGGGMCNFRSSSPTLTNVSIRGNSASYGGGIYDTLNSIPSITNVIISGNIASLAGGAIYNTTNSSSVIINATISGNTASLAGGAIYNATNSSPGIYNTIIWGNNTGLFNAANCMPTLRNCLIQEINEDTADCISAATVDSASLFMAAISHTRASSTSGDYSLKINSPVINMGNNAYNSTTNDIAGNLRIIGTAIDLGAYESRYLTVNFDATGGTPIPNTQYIVYDGKVVLPVNPTNRGYCFTGWYTQVIGGIEWDFATSKITQDTTLYAQWTAAYTVAFDATGGTLVPDTQYIVPNGTVVSPANPTRSGYTFNGWYNQISDGIEWDFATSKVTQDTTLYAQWSTNNIDILDILYDNNKLQQNSLLDYQVLCAESGSSFTFTISVNSGNILSGNGISGNTLTVNIPKAGIYSFPFSITSQDGSQTENHVLKVERHYAFDEIVKVKWNNTLMVYLNRLSSDGFDVAFYRWYKGNTLLDEKSATYSAGNNATDLLSSTEPYRVEIVLKNGEVIRSCSETITIVPTKNIRFYPNPAIAGQTITVEADLRDEDAVITIYDAQGTPLSTTRLQGSHTQVQLPIVAGSYLLSISGKNGVIYSTTTIVK